MAHDFRNGLVVDGIGSEPYVGDVTVKDDKVSYIGRGSPAGPQEIDASGSVVTRRFIDLHTHLDMQFG